MPTLPLPQDGTQSAQSTPDIVKQLKQTPSLVSALMSGATNPQVLGQTAQDVGSYMQGMPGQVANALNPVSQAQGIQANLKPATDAIGSGIQDANLQTQTLNQSADLAFRIGQMVKTGKLDVVEAAKFVSQLPQVYPKDRESLLNAFLHGALAGAGAVNLGGMAQGAVNMAGELNGAMQAAAMSEPHLGGVPDSNPGFPTFQNAPLPGEAAAGANKFADQAQGLVDDVNKSLDTPTKAAQMEGQANP